MFCQWPIARQTMRRSGLQVRMETTSPSSMFYASIAWRLRKVRGEGMLTAAILTGMPVKRLIKSSVTGALQTTLMVDHYGGQLTSGSKLLTPIVHNKQCLIQALMLDCTWASLYWTNLSHTSMLQFVQEYSWHPWSAMSLECYIMDGSSPFFQRCDRNSGHRFGC